MLALGLLAASPASAAYEQVGVLSPLTTGPLEDHEEVELGGLGGLAVNYTGAGGVPAGTVYAATREGAIARYAPDGHFLERWTFGKAETKVEPEPGVREIRPEELPQRCGPDGEPAYPVCEQNGNSQRRPVDVEVDQSTGDVYAIRPEQIAPSNGSEPVHGPSGQQDIAIFSPDGSQVIARFGEQAVSYNVETEPHPGEKRIETRYENLAETPAKIHTVSDFGAIALDSSDGTLYVSDMAFHENEYTRLMVFKPASPGDYEHYVYAGRSDDIWAGIYAEGVSGAFPFPAAPRHPVADAAGHLYISSEQYIAKLDPTQPDGAPLCQLNYPKGGIVAITVNPLTEELFFSDYKDQKIHQLRCDAQGEFLETGSFAALPSSFHSVGTLWISGLAVDPLRSFDPSRPAGILFAGTGEGASPGGEVGNTDGFVFAPPPGLPPAVDSESVTHVTATTALLHAQINPHSNRTRYAFQYLDQAAYDAQKALAEGEGKNPEEVQEAAFAGAAEAPPGGALLGEGTKALSAAAALTGLKPDTAYRFRVLASSFCNSEEPEVPCESAGPGRSLHTYPTELPGLPDHRAYELVSPTQKHGGQVFPADPTRSSCEFGECKPGSDSSYPGFPYLASADGDSIAYRGSAFSFTEGAVEENQYLARRTPSGWQSVDPTPALFVGGSLGSAYAAFDPLDPELSQAILFPGTASGILPPALSPTAPPGYQDIYTQTTLAPPFALTPVLTAAPPNRPAEGPELFKLRYAGASQDLSRIFFEANDALTEASGDAPEAADGGASKNNLYEWSVAGLKLVNVDPGNVTAVPGAAFPRTSTSATGTIANTTVAAGAISTDGSRAFWIGADGQLYLREDAQRTVEVSASQRATEDPVHSPATFLAASVDGTRALFSSSQELTEDADTGLAQEIKVSATAGTYKLGFEGEQTAGLPYTANATQIQAALEALPRIGAGNLAATLGKNGPVITFAGALATNQEEMSVDATGLTGTVTLHSSRPGTDLYLWHEGALTDLSAGPGRGEFRGLIGASEDLSHLYFIDGARLDAAPSQEGEVATQGADNLYSYSEGTTRFIARYNPDEQKQNLSVPWTATTSPDGRWLAFRSQDPLTRFDSTGPCAISGGQIVTGPCAEIFLYDSATGSLTCPSCNPSGASPLGNSSLPLVGTAAPQRPLHFVTDSGRLYFDSQDSLVPADTNEGAEDVYEYEPAGAGEEGTCERPAGCVFLISAGRNHADSNLAAIDPSGKNVFFTTWDQLARKDRDDLMDLYDAREGGGIPAESEAASPGCQGEACLPAYSPPNDPTPGSSTFHGSGNVKESQAKACPKGKVKGKGKCLKKHAKHHKDRKRHHRRAAGHTRRAHR